MRNIPDKYNTDGLIDLTTAWKDLLTLADGASEKEIYELSENVLKKLNKPITKENVDIVIRTLISQVKINING